MLIKFLGKKTIKNYTLVQNDEVRTKYGCLTSLLGITINLILSALKMIFGIIANSISLISDSINNFFDCTNSIVSLLGFKLNSKPKDKEHPFGHARSEFIAGVIVSSIVVAIGATLLFENITSLINGTTNVAVFSFWTIGVAVLSIVLKLVLALETNYTANLINSITLKANVKDSIYDIVLSVSLLISMIVTYFLNIAGIYFNIDTYLGILIAIFIIYGGIKSIISTANPLLGEQYDQGDIEKISNCITDFPQVLGFHDLLIHSYGGHNCYISVHIELDSRMSLIESHALVDEIEKKIKEDFKGLDVTIHIDPIILDNNTFNDYRIAIEELFKKDLNAYKYHDLRFYYNKDSQLVITLDLIIPYSNFRTKAETSIYEKNIVTDVSHKINNLFSMKIKTRITIDYPLN